MSTLGDRFRNRLYRFLVGAERIFSVRRPILVMAFSPALLLSMPFCSGEEPPPLDVTVPAATWTPFPVPSAVQSAVEGPTLVASPLATVPQPLPTATLPAPSTVSLPGQEAVIRNFVHPNIRVAAGQWVVWVNRDQVPHTVKQGTPGQPGGGLFRSPDIQPGQTFSFVFETPGRFEYFCEIHLSMTAYVLAEGSQAQPAPIPAIPAPTPVPPTPTPTGVAASPSPVPATASPTQTPGGQTAAPVTPTVTGTMPPPFGVPTPGSGGSSTSTFEAPILDSKLPNPAVESGTTIKWINQDTVGHALVSGEPNSETGEFNSGVIGENGSFSHLFTVPGNYPYFCAVHPTQMRGTVTITE